MLLELARLTTNVIVLNCLNKCVKEMAVSVQIHELYGLIVRRYHLGPWQFLPLLCCRKTVGTEYDGITVVACMDGELMRQI